MSFGTKKTVHKKINPVDKGCLLTSSTVCNIGGWHLTFVVQFKYLGQRIDNFMCNDSDINREKKLIYTVRTSKLILGINVLNAVVLTLHAF